MNPVTFKEVSSMDKKKLLQLIARISEASFRRGVQHSSVMKTSEDLAFKFRFIFSKDHEIWLQPNSTYLTSRKDHRPNTIKSCDRLISEHGSELSSFGFEVYE